MEKDVDNEETRDELRETREENDRLRAENQRLKALLESFAIRPASSLPTPPPKNKEVRAPSTKRQAKKPPPSTSSEPPADQNPRTPIGTAESLSTREEKIELFRSLFRGREDVFALRWESKKGRSGYSPACANEWHPMLCKKPCSKCQNAEYVPVSNEAVRDHVLGKEGAPRVPGG